MAIDIAQHNFAAGQSVGVYLASTVSRDKVETNRSPDGAAVDTLTVEDDGTLSVDATGYDVGTYYAAGQIVHTDTTTVTGATGLDVGTATIRVTVTEIREDDNTTPTADPPGDYYLDVTAIPSFSGDVTVTKASVPRARTHLDGGWDYVTFTVTDADV